MERPWCEIAEMEKRFLSPNHNISFIFIPVVALSRSCIKSQSWSNDDFEYSLRQTGTATIFLSREKITISKWFANHTNNGAVAMGKVKKPATWFCFVFCLLYFCFVLFCFVFWGASYSPAELPSSCSVLHHPASKPPKIVKRYMIFQLSVTHGGVSSAVFLFSLDDPNSSIWNKVVYTIVNRCG